jgi:hypothetical protein
MGNIVRATELPENCCLAEEPVRKAVEITPSMGQARVNNINRVAERITVGEALDAKAYYRSDVRVRATLKVLQDAYTKLKHENAIMNEQLGKRQAEQEATEEALLKTTKRLDTLIDAVDLHACSSIGLAASTWLKLMDIMGSIKRCIR